MPLRFSLFTLLFIWVFLPQSATACSCARSDFEQGFLMADAVFSGIVSSVKTPEAEDLEASNGLADVILRAHAVWKGPEEEYITVKTHVDKQACGFHFLSGMQYLVFAFKNTQGALQVSVCGRTSEFFYEAEEDLRALRFFPFVSVHPHASNPYDHLQ